MTTTDWYIIYSLTMPSSWLAFFISIVAVAITLYLRFDKQLTSIFIDASFAFILVWKLSVIVTDFQTVLNQPLSILYFNGGYVGVGMGTIAAFYVLFKANYLEPKNYRTFPLLMSSYYLFFMVLLNENNPALEIFILATALSALVLTWIGNQRLLLGVAVLLFFSTFFQPLGVFQPYTFLLIGVGIGIEVFIRFSTKKVVAT